MRIYIAGAWGERERLREHAAELEAMGHLVTADWLHADASVPYVTGDPDIWAARVLGQIRHADLLIYDTEGQSRGGRDTELGVALGLGTPIIIVGPIDTDHASLFVLATPRTKSTVGPHFADWRHLAIAVTGRVGRPR